MGRGNGNTASTTSAATRRSDFFDVPEDERPKTGQPWKEHVRDLKAACDLMMELVRESEPGGLTLPDIGNTALYCGVAQENVGVARDLLRVHHGILMDMDGRWHLNGDEAVLDEWRKQTRV